MALKLMAAQNRKSIAELVRKGVNLVIRKKTRQQKPKVSKLLRELAKLARENAKQNPGISFSDKLIEMRYEQ